MLLNTDFMIKTFWVSLKAVPVTLEITFVSLLLAVIPAYIIARNRIKNIKIAAFLGKIFVSFMRGTPILLQILIVYSLFPSLLNGLFKVIAPKVNVFDINPIVYAFIVFSLNISAMLSEVFRSALQTVDKGQYEAALCSGMNHIQSYFRIVLPQAMVSALPNLCNLVINLIKNSSLAFLMTVKDITAVAKIEASYGFNYIEAYLDIFVIYILICSVIQFLFRFIEKRTKFLSFK